MCAAAIMGLYSRERLCDKTTRKGATVSLTGWRGMELDMGLQLQSRGIIGQREKNGRSQSFRVRSMYVSLLCSGACFAVEKKERERERGREIGSGQIEGGRWGFLCLGVLSFSL